MMDHMERKALDMLLAGEDPLLEVLRAQLASVAVIERDFSGVGFHTSLSVPDGVPRAENCPRKVIGDVYAEITGLEHSAGFQLYVLNGVLDCLECYIVDSEWPNGATLIRAYYVQPQMPGSSQVVEAEKRDLEWALRV